MSQGDDDDDGAGLFMLLNKRRDSVAAGQWKCLWMTISDVRP
jgi:hypothetical protein